MSLTDLLNQAIDACAALPDAVDPAALRAATAALADPWRVAVVGRVGSGKSSLINALAPGSARPVGLGGVTTACVDVPVGTDLVILDTPGIDDPDRALVALQPVLEGVDAVIWVIDGLQPMTASERDVMAASLVDQTPLTLVVSKADLQDEADREAVVRRAKILAEGWRLQQVVPLDLRTTAQDVPPSLVAPRPPGPRRSRAILDAIDAIEADLAGIPTLPGQRELVAAWSAAIRRAADAVDADITAGRITHKTDALVALGEHTRSASAAVQAALGPVAAPRLPAPEAPSTAALAQVLGGMSGREGAHRVLKAGAARWLAEGQLVLQEWWLDQDDLRARAAAIEALRGHLAAVRRAASASIRPEEDRGARDR